MFNRMFALNQGVTFGQMYTTVDRTVGAVANSLDTTYIVKKAVPALQKELVHSDQITQPVNMPEGVGTTARWIIPINLTQAATNALTVGTDNIGYSTRSTTHENVFSVTKVEKQVDLYGSFVPIRKVDLKGMPKNTMDMISGRLSYLGALTADTLIRATVDGTGTGFSPSMGAGTTLLRRSIRAGNNQTLAAGDQITAEDIFLAVGDLRALDAQPFDDGFMHACLSEACITMLETDVSTSRVTWWEASKYTSGMTGTERIAKRSPGAIGGCLILGTNNIAQATIDSIASTWENIVYAKDAVGTVGIGEEFGNEPTIYINEAGSQSMDDPFRLFATISFQFLGAPKLLDSSRVEVLYSAP